MIIQYSSEIETVIAYAKSELSLRVRGGESTLVGRELRKLNIV